MTQTCPRVPRRLRSTHNRIRERSRHMFRKAEHSRHGIQQDHAPQTHRAERGRGGGTTAQTKASFTVSLPGLEHTNARKLTRIAEMTINKLFSAQKHVHEQPPSSFQKDETMSDDSPPTDSVVETATPQKSTLHSFWSLPPPRAATRPTLQRQPSAFSRPQAPRCQDCDAPLGDIGAMAIDVDDYSVGEDHACGSCGRCVCDTCAVNYGGDDRMCLSCATGG